MNRLYQQQLNQLSRRQFQSPQATNSVGDLYRKFKQSKDKNGFILNLMQNNPKFKEAIDLVQQNGGNAEQVFYQLAQQKGINPDSILNPLR